MTKFQFLVQELEYIFVIPVLVIPEALQVNWNRNAANITGLTGFPEEI